MKEFRIKSCESDLELVFSEAQGDYFTVEIKSISAKAIRKVWAYTDSYTLADLLESLSESLKPWPEPIIWESLEEEFKLIISCSNTGNVYFEIQLKNISGGEDWQVNYGISSEFGQLPMLASMARNFFGESPN